MGKVRSLLRSLRGWRRLDAEMEEEFRSHVAHRAADLVEAGERPAEALRRARLEFGSAAEWAEEGRAARGLAWLDGFRGDLRYAVRSLARTPRLTAVMVLTLGLGVGANAAVFSLVDAMLLRPLPFPEADRLVLLQERRDDGHSASVRWSPAEYAALAAALDGIEAASHYSTDLNLSGAGLVPARVRAEIVSPSYLRVLRVEPARGRGFAVAEAGAAAVILSDGLWQRLFGADPSVLERRLVLNGVAVEVVGVAPAGFRGLTGGAELWLPSALAPSVYFADFLTSPQRFLTVTGRVRDGTTAAAAAAEVASAGAAAAAAARGDGLAEESFARRVEAVPLAEARADPATGRARLALAGAAFFVLVIAGINLSGLLLARAYARARDTAVRAALGAGRGQLVRHAAVEGMVLGVLGGAAGAVLGSWSVHALLLRAPERTAGAAWRGADVGAFSTPAADWRVVLFALGAGLVAALVAAAVPAMRVARDGAATTLRGAGRGSTARTAGSGRRAPLLSAAVVAQVACSLVLLTAAGLLLDGLHRLRNRDPGFDASGVLSFRITPPESRYGGDAAAPLLARVLEQVEALPGVQAATVDLCPPVERCAVTPVYLDGIDDAGSPPLAGRHYVAPAYFETLRIPLLRGRGLSDADRAGALRVAVINQTAARTLWPGSEPIGRYVRFGSGGGFASPDSLTRIVGVVADVQYGPPGTPVRPEFYTSYSQFTWPHTTVMLRTAGDPLALATAVRRAVATIDPALPIHDVFTLQQRTADSLAWERFASSLLGAVAALGLTLTALGIFGIMTWTVTQRRREIGIRMALGAPARGVARLVVGRGAALAAAGLALGALGSLPVGRAIPAITPHARTADPLVLAAVAALLMATAALACWLPARAAVRVNPVETLGAE
jgi:putative ABC transport system permease protein